MVDIIKSLCYNRNIKIKYLEKELNMGNGTIRVWDEKRPSVDKVKRVADYFGVTVDYLLTGEEKQTDAYAGLSEEALMIAKIVDALPPEHRRLLLAQVQGLASEQADPAFAPKSE